MHLYFMFTSVTLTLLLIILLFSWNHNLIHSFLESQILQIMLLCLCVLCPFNILQQNIVYATHLIIIASLTNKQVIKHQYCRMALGIVFFLLLFHYFVFIFDLSHAIIAMVSILHYYTISILQ